MALVVADRVQETSSTSGTGTLTLAGAVAGYQSFSTGIGNGNTTFYTIYDPTTFDWEVGIGTVGAGTLARTTVLSNSAGTFVPLSFAGNTKFVFCTYPAEKSINYDANGVATIGEELNYADTGIVGSFASTVAGYNQVIVQNKSSATNASSNLNVSNDAGTAGSNYAELGINSSTFTGAGSFNIAGASYVASASTDLTLGTYGAYNVHFVTNSNTTDAMTIFDNGGISLGGFANPGIANMAASKFVPGYSAVTSAAGTTVLTASSNYYQNLLGTTTQTFQLPDATTLLVGTTFIFDNDSTGNLSVVDNASGPIETVPGGAASFVYLANNGTVAGTWRRHAFLPASYDFNATTANFGNAIITNATWNGDTIGTAYGGTGLTSFSAANYALYSTSSSALTAGTLPVAAGGSGAVTFTANGVLYGNGTSPLGVTAAGVTGEVLVGNTGSAPSWATLSSSTVSSFSAGTTGFTPNSATTGAVTLAGTLNVANGGTGQTTYTDGELLIGNTTGNTLTKATLTGTTSQVTVTNGNGSITLSLPSTINVNTSGSAATLTTSRNIYGNSFNGSADVTGIIASSFGGTGNGFTKFSGPTTSEKTFTLPDASATILTTNTAVTIAQGGTGQTTATAAFDALNPMTTVGDLIYEDTGPTATRLPIGSTNQVLTVVGGIPSWATPSANVSSFQTSLSGLTPSTATSGAVTLAGTLGPTSGGTGLASYTTGDIIYASATNTLSKLAAGTDGYVLTMASGVPSWAVNNATTSRTVTDFTATAGQTTFSVTYTVGYIDVFRNGVKLASADYTATNGTSVVLATGANDGDIIQTIAYATLSVAGGVTSFSGGTTGLTPSTPSAGAISLSGTLAVANGGTGVTTSTGTGNNVLSTSPTLVTPILGTPTSGTLTNCTGYTTANLSGNINLTSQVTGILPVSNGGTNASSAGIAAFNNITGYSASGATGTTSTNLVFSASPTFTGTLGAATISATANISTSGGTVSDSKGDVRAAPIQSKTSAYVLVATDAGQTISITTGGVTVDASVFSAGDMVSIFNNSGTSQTITQGASVTLRLSGTATTGSRTLAQYGVATLLCVVGGATPTFACTGAGLT